MEYVEEFRAIYMERITKKFVILRRIEVTLGA